MGNYNCENEETEEKEKRIEQERKRIARLFSKIDRKKRAIVEGLIDRAAFMRVSLADLEEDLKENGFTDWFSQGNQEPYQRRRPAAEQYNAMVINYQKAIKQLTDLLPRDAERPQDDGFDSFVNGRAEV